jgi:hypothetical protein
MKRTLESDTFKAVPGSASTEWSVLSRDLRGVFRASALLRTAWVVILVSVSARAAEPWVSETPRDGDFALVTNGRAAEIVVSADDFKVAGIAASDFAADVERVTGVKPVLRSTAALEESANKAAPVVLIGTLGKHAWIDALVAQGKLDVSSLRGAWESFLIATVDAPRPGISRALVVAGSDRRGTAYGVYELSQAIGVSPWYWWADVAPTKKSALHVAADTRRFGPPSVKYRGIFINDEDWGLQPWAAKTFEPEVGDIGPKTYAKVFELLLRLKANTLWPAMHACTKPFNHYPQNAPLADDYGIVMGSSHAEPMLRNNVGEWTDEKNKFNYATNRKGVLGYWEERVKTNARFENVYTLGMRGIHDSGMQGGKTPAEQRALLEKIFADQRELLAKYVAPEVERVPQIFCAYKEVLQLFRGGLRVPDDVTIVWPDDNFGFIRSFANAQERKRPGGFGVYYHISYLGRPLAYLWLNTMPPGLIWSEMRKAYDHGADRVWIVNVGDIKPAEIGMEFFLQMAWDIERWNADNLPQYLVEWAAREFGAGQAKAIAAAMAEYYLLNYQRKPEHLQWWLPSRPPQPSELTAAEREARLARFEALRSATAKIAAALSPDKRDAFFQLVGYPVEGSALANERYFQGERAALATQTGEAERAREFAEKAAAADRQLIALTERFGQEIAGGKWRGFMRLEPADNDWKSMRIAPWAVPSFVTSAPNENQPARPAGAESALLEDVAAIVERDGVVAFNAASFVGQRVVGAAEWKKIPGLGRSGEAVTVLPSNLPSIDPARLAQEAACLDYAITFSNAGEFTAEFHLVPTHPIPAGEELRFAVALGEAAPQLVTLAVGDGGAEWARGVLAGARIARSKLVVPGPGTHVLRIYAVDAGVALDKVVIDCGGLEPSYLGPAPTLRAAPLKK